MKTFEFNPTTDFAKYKQLLLSNLTFNNVVNEDRCDSTIFSKRYKVTRYNVWLHDFLEQHLNMKVEYEFKLNQFTYDLRIGNILINLNPTMSHNVTCSYRWLKGHIDDTFQFDAFHHVKQTMNALQHGMFCIHVWDWDAWEPLITIIKHMLSTSIIDVNDLQVTQIPLDTAIAWSNDKCYQTTWWQDKTTDSFAYALIDSKHTIHEMLICSYTELHPSYNDWQAETMLYTIPRHVKVSKVHGGTAKLLNACMQHVLQSTYDEFESIDAIDAASWLMHMYFDCSKTMLDSELLNVELLDYCDIYMPTYMRKYKAANDLPQYIDSTWLQEQTERHHIPMIWSNDMNEAYAKFEALSTPFNSIYPYLQIVGAGAVAAVCSFDSSLLK